MRPTFVLILFAAWSVAADEQVPGVQHLLVGRELLYQPAGGYANHSFADFRLPETSQLARKHFYGPLGEHLIYGYSAYTWRETRATSSLGDAPTSIVTRTRLAPFKNTVVARDHYKNGATAVIISDEIRTVFSPLTLRWAGINGVRLDAVQGDNSLSMVGSRLTEFPGGTQGDLRNAPFFGGTHVERQFGRLRVGATALNTHKYDGSQRDFDLRGQLQSNQVAPSFLVVRFRDDSPRDETGGAVVADVVLHVNGEERRDLRPTFVRLNATNPTALGRTNRLTGQFQRTSYRDAGTKYADYFYLLRHLNGEQVTQANVEELVRWIQILPGGSTQQADGDWVVEAFFDLRGIPYVRQVEVATLVGNDYHVDVLGIYDDDPRQRTEEGRWSVGGVEAWARSEGNVQDLSNLDWVQLDVGEWTGRSLVGVNAIYESPGLQIRAEYARTSDHRQYPDGPPAHRGDAERSGVRRWQGERTRTTDEAWYINAMWIRERWQAGGEWYYTGPDFHRPIAIPQRVDPSTVGAVEPPRDGFVEDNDDNDRFPDRGPGEFRQGHFGDLASDPDGVFPGNDADHDGVPDSNRNQNAVPDWEEPFLLFYTEPDIYVYGRDWNHNGVVDVREDDEEPDYPYKVDTRGLHLFGSLSPLRGLTLTAGRLDGEGIASGGPNESTYGRVAYGAGNKRWGRLQLETSVERVRDDIEDDYRIFDNILTRPAGGANFADRLTLGFLHKDVHDRLEWRDSWQQEHYAEWRLTPLAGLTLHGNTRWSVNHQQGGLLIEGRDLGKDKIRLLTTVARAEYEWTHSDYRVIAQGKLLRLRQVRDSSPEALADEWLATPILKGSYRLTPRTQIWLGFQGLPGLPLRNEDNAININTYEESVWALQLTNRSPYLGYDILVSLGLKSQRRIYEDPSRDLDNRETRSVFLRVLLGYHE